MNKKVKEYMDLPYTRITKKITDTSGTYYLCRIMELDGCHTCGDTVEEVEKNIDDALQGYIEIKLEAGFDIPKPVEIDDYSGKFVVRLPKQLHQRLAIEAQEEGVSLNQYALYKLAK